MPAFVRSCVTVSARILLPCRNSCHKPTRLFWGKGRSLHSKLLQGINKHQTIRPSFHAKSRQCSSGTLKEAGVPWLPWRCFCVDASPGACTDFSSQNERAAAWAASTNKRRNMRDVDMLASGTCVNTVFCRVLSFQFSMMQHPCRSSFEGDGFD